jgi:hypothetical protein
MTFWIVMAPFSVATIWFLWPRGPVKGMDND